MLTVETGSGSSSSDSYISVADFESYNAARGYTLAGNAEQLLLQAMLYVDNLSFKGWKLTKAQSLQWPRNGVYIDSYAINTDEIPQQLIDLQCEVALSIDAGSDPLANVDRAVKREKVDVIEVEYADNAAPYAYSRKIKALEKKLTNGSGGMVVDLFRS